jgi:hypothetical protein
MHADQFETRLAKVRHRFATTLEQDHRRGRLGRPDVPQR